MIMDIKDILAVGLTFEDLDLMLKGLDAIPEERKARETLNIVHGSMLDTVFGQVHPDQLRRDLEKKFSEIHRKVDSDMDDLTIVKSKIIQLKRHLLSNEAARVAQEIISGG